MEEKSTGVDMVLSRMKTNPEEFFDYNKIEGRWSFLYKEYFQDFLSEGEKARLTEGLVEVRRKEFDAVVVKTLMRAEEQERQSRQEALRNSGNLVRNLNQMAGYGQALQPSPFGAVPKREGDSV